MAEVYTFKVTLRELEDRIWRKMEISSAANLEKLCFAVLAAFGAEGSHLFGIECKGKRYEATMDDDDAYGGDRLPTEPLDRRLSALALRAGDEMRMAYDYGAGWVFRLELVSIEPMKRGLGAHYPYLTDGRGRGILEDTSPGELAQIIKSTDKDGILPEISDSDGSCCVWDYRAFDLRMENAILKGEILRLQDAYHGNDWDD